MQLHITHTTTYHYVPHVTTAQHMAYLLPRTTPAQQVLATNLFIDPEPGTRAETQDVYGNVRTFFSLPTPHKELTITAQSLVKTTPCLFDASDTVDTPAWEKVRTHFQYHAGAAWDAATEFSFASAFVQPHADFAHYARASFTAQRPILQAAVDLMRRIHSDFDYVSQSTDVHTPAREALAKRQGVCQDFAHILLSCLRTQGLSARYVSGYLLTEPPEGQPRLIGSDASHAWVSLYVPDVSDEGLSTQGRWFDLDPTNDRWGLNAPGADYVCLAWGRDFGDVSPLRGVLHGGANHTLDVAVTVSPAEVFPSDTD